MIITSETWKDTYLAKLRESRDTGRSLSDICQADPVWMESHRLDLVEHGLA
jgi:hypothetical protein